LGKISKKRNTEWGTVSSKLIHNINISYLASRPALGGLAGAVMGDSTDVENSPQIDKEMQNKAKFYIRRQKTEN